jgi:hypothetical protein
VYHSESLDPTYYTLGYDVGTSPEEQDAKVQDFLSANTMGGYGNDIFQWGKRITRVNTLPMSILLVLVITLTVVWMLLTTVVGNLILVSVHCCCCCCCCKKTIIHLLFYFYLLLLMLRCR